MQSIDKKINDLLRGWANCAKKEENDTRKWTLNMLGPKGEKELDSWSNPPSIKKLKEAIYDLKYYLDDEEKLNACCLTFERIDKSGSKDWYNEYDGLDGRLLNYILYEEMSEDLIIKKINNLGVLDCGWGSKFKEKFSCDDCNKVVLYEDNEKKTWYYIGETKDDEYIDFHINLYSDDWITFYDDSFYAEFLNDDIIIFKWADTPKELLELLQDKYLD